MNFSLKVKNLTSGQPITLCFVFPKIVDIHILCKNNKEKEVYKVGVCRRDSFMRSGSYER